MQIFFGYIAIVFLIATLLIIFKFSFKKNNKELTHVSNSSLSKFIAETEEIILGTEPTFLMSVIEKLNEKNSLKESLFSLIKLLGDQLNWKYGSIWLSDDKGALSCIASYGNEVKTDDLPAAIAKFNFIKSIQTKTDPLYIEEMPHDIDDSNDFLQEFKSAFVFPILFANKVIGMFEFFLDEKIKITENLLKLFNVISFMLAQHIEIKTSAQILKESETHKHAILKSSIDAIFTVNDQGNIISANQQAKKIFRCEAEDLITKNINHFVPGLRSLLKTIEGNSALELTAKHIDGTNFPSELSIADMFVEHAHCFVIALRDTSQQKKHEHEKNEFIALLSQELGAPLTSIKGSLDLIIEILENQFNDTANNLLKIALKNSEHLIKLMNDILDIEKIKLGKMIFNSQKINIVELINAVLSDNIAYSEKHFVKVELQSLIDSIYISGDSKRLEQVFSYLIKHFIRLSRPNEIIKISIHVAHQIVQIIFVVCLNNTVLVSKYESIQFMLSKLLIQAMQGEFLNQGAGDKVIITFNVPTSVELEALILPA